MEVESGGGTKGRNLSRGHGIKDERDFPAEAGPGGAAVHNDGFEIHDAVAARGGQMDTEGEGGAGFTRPIAPENRPMLTDLLQFKLGKLLPCRDTGGGRPRGGDHGSCHRVGIGGISGRFVWDATARVPGVKHSGILETIYARELTASP